ncbi:MAG: amylo-alpha-1,6-glucosidase, partial [Bacteroidales bacterium]|nr:amylo-alpha-1,6-glucosidase [Bacteroidales bacterium]
EHIENGVKAQLYKGFPWLHMQFSSKVEFIQAPDWYFGVEYLEEQKRGYDCSEDLFTPGFFEMEARADDVIIFSASTEEEKTAGLKQKFTRTVSAKTPRNSFVNCLRNAAQQFVEKRNGKTALIAGFPWFGAWGRDTFISLPGIALARPKQALYTEVLDTQTAKMKNGLFPNMGSDDNPAFNSVDAPLWFFRALQHYAARSTDCWECYGEAAKSVLYAYRNGTGFNIRMHGNGLIHAGAPGKSLTWMDAVVNGMPVTPRNGYQVEINALWYNAVCFALEMAEKAGDRQFMADFASLPELIRASFIETFWDEKAGYLADYVNSEEGRNMYIRPNMAIAVSLPHTMPDREQMKKTLDVIDRNLVTPRGLRTLSPSNEHYRGIYRGGQEERDRAYHQGTVWPWLLGPFCEGWLKVYGRQGVAKVHKLIYGLEEVMGEAGVSSISEIYDGDPPHAPRGAISQAWSVGEVLRIIDMLETEFNDK